MISYLHIRIIMFKYVLLYYIYGGNKMQKQSLQELLVNAQSRQNMSIPNLVIASIKNGEGVLTDKGALRVATGKYTGRSPNDKYVVLDPITENNVNWGPINQVMSPQQFDVLYQDMLAYLNEKEIYIFDGYAGASSDHQQSLRVINEYAWQNMFIHQLLIRPNEKELKDFIPNFHIICAPGFKANPKKHGTNSEVAVVLNFTENIILIAGSSYAGEIKKSIFTLMNYILPLDNVLSMHCSANKGKNGDTALFFGLSGTGKTTLSADPERSLIGDDEHGWSEEGIFNIEGGCYAKCIDLDPQAEPQIYNAIRFGSVLENVTIDEKTQTPDYKSRILTENTRAAYPVNYIPGAVIPGNAGHPSSIFFLTADAFGVLPPIARLNKEQAMYHFLSGYTSKLAGTERGIKEPQTTFSECFGSPFLPLAPIFYANLLGEKIDKYNSNVFLINTGWTGGPYGVGSRFKIAYTRAIIKAALEGSLDNIEYYQDPTFGFSVPKECPGVPKNILYPKSTWANQDEYDSYASKLAVSFVENFKKFNNIPDEILQASPKI